MKKTLIFILSLLLCLSLIACDSSKPEDTTGEDATSAEETTADITPKDVAVPTLLCDLYDTVNIELVDTKGDFDVDLKVPENASAIVPHFTLSSDMVLQRRAVNLIHGRTSASHVAVEFGGKTYYGKVDRGNFEVYLPPMEAAAGSALIIYTESAKLTLKNVAVGEVFLLGGQSNMVWSLGWSDTIHASDIANANNKNLRLFRMLHTESRYERDDCDEDVSWCSCSPSAAKDFSAVGYLFGKRILETLGVPVGLVQAAVSGSCIAFWLPAADLDAYVASGKTAYTSTASSNLEASLGYNGMIHPLTKMRFRALLWNQGEANTSDAAYYADELELLIGCYREIFNNPLMGFSIMETAKATADHAEKWAPVKAAQQKVAKTVEYASYSCNIDLGYSEDVHPRDKTEYAKRAAEAALHDFFGIETAPYPYVESISKIASDTVVITLGGGSAFELRNGANGFETSADGKKYVDVKSAKLEGNVLVLTAAGDVSYVRYGVRYYDGVTDFTKHVTLFNSDGKPLDQFIEEVK